MKTIIDFTNKVKSLVDGRMSNIANVETSPSTHPYAVGKQLIFNGLLCKATSAIAVGDTLAVGTNLALSDNVVEQIYSLNQGLSNSLADMNNVLGAKNLLPNNATNQTVNGVTFTVNDDGSITANGTATSQISLVLAKTNLEANKYKLSGVPNGSADNTYFMIFYSPSNNIWHDACYDTDADRLIFNSYSDDELNIIIRSGQTVSDITFKPMIRPASIQDDTYVPYSMTNREMTPYVQAISNPNLLDNPWFTVNQRGQSSYSNLQWKYTVDRFMLRTNDGFSVTDDGLKAETSNGFSLLQRIEKARFAGKANEIFTLSILLSTGEIFTASGTPTHSFSFFNERVGIVFYNSETSFEWNGINIFVYNNTDVIRAVKLELGSVSTLAMDTAPNYQQELAKCQRYYQRINTRANVTFGLALAISATIAIMPITINTMRAFPSVGKDVTGMSLRTADDATSNAITAINGFLEGDVSHGVLTFTSTSLVVGTIYKVEFANSTSYIDFSADLQ